MVTYEGHSTQRNITRSYFICSSESAAHTEQKLLDVGVTFQIVLECSQILWSSRTFYRMLKDHSCLHFFFSLHIFINCEALMVARNRLWCVWCCSQTLKYLSDAKSMVSQRILRRTFRNNIQSFSESIVSSPSSFWIQIQATNQPSAENI